jgi:hypothetical protein
MIKIQRISENGLTKHEYCFSTHGDTLVYTSWYEYNRSNKREKWADEKPKPLSIGDWCKKHNKDIEDIGDDYFGSSEYIEYLNKLNPVLQKTRSGKTKLWGTVCSNIKDLPKCPEDVAKDAYYEFCKQLKVVYQ